MALRDNNRIKENDMGLLNGAQHKQFLLNVDVLIRQRQPIFITRDKVIRHAQWIKSAQHNCDVVLVELRGESGKRENYFFTKYGIHKHIIRTFGTVYDPADENTIKLLQEYAPQGNLEELLSNMNRNLRDDTVTTICMQVIDAMIYLASKQVVHGDLACRNILVFRLDENQVNNTLVKLTDFGISMNKHYRSVPTDQRNKQIVPIRYCAPEIFEQHFHYSAFSEKSDVFAFGVTLWEILSKGKIPWNNLESDTLVIQKVRNGEILKRPKGCSQKLRGIMKTAWSQSPKTRPNFRELKSLFNDEPHESEKKDNWNRRPSK